MLKLRLEKSVYVPGVIAAPFAASNSWRLMQPTRIIQMTATLGTLPTGAGQTIVRAVRNNDPSDELFSVQFTEGGAFLLTDSGEQTLAAGDTVQLIVPELAAGTGGQDLLCQFLYCTLTP